MPDSVLDDSQLLALSILVYRLDRVQGIHAGARLSHVAGEMHDILLERQAAYNERPDDMASQLMSYREWGAVLDHIATNRSFEKMMVRAYEIDDKGAKSLLVGDEWGNAYAAFSGTGAGEWKDNAEAAYTVQSEQQLRAMRWLKRACAENQIERITACGHSKGGNKAFYLAVRLPQLVVRAVGFDAQGFSRQFVRSYGDGILANTAKLASYALDNDYVNGLLASIVLHKQRIYVSGFHVENPLAYHSPYSLFVPNHGASGSVLELGARVEQGGFGRAFAEFSDYAEQHTTDDEYRQLCTSVGQALENILVPGVDDAERIRRGASIGASEGFKLFVSLLGRFFEEHPQGVSPTDIIRFLLPGGERGATVFDDVALSALDALSEFLKTISR